MFFVEISWTIESICKNREFNPQTVAKPNRDTCDFASLFAFGFELFFFQTRILRRRFRASSLFELLKNESKILQKLGLFQVRFLGFFVWLILWKQMMTKWWIQYFSTFWIFFFFFDFSGPNFFFFLIFSRRREKFWNE